jgi:pentatricopeptide repeat domain-containing protein 1
VCEFLYVQDLEPEVRTFNTAIIACNMCGQSQEALKVCHGVVVAFSGCGL